MCSARTIGLLAFACKGINVYFLILQRDKKMKKLLKILVLAAGLVLCLNANSFANISFSAWGGWSSVGYDGPANPNPDSKFGMNDWQYGISTHYNLSSGPIGLALGGYFQYTRVNFKELVSPEQEVKHNSSRMSAGADAALYLLIWSWVDPYVRGTYAFYDKYDRMSGTGFGIGGGFEFNFTPSVKLFAELMYESATYSEKSNKEVEYDLSQMAINLGFTYVIKF